MCPLPLYFAPCCPNSTCKSISFTQLLTHQPPNRYRFTTGPMDYRCEWAHSVAELGKVPPDLAIKLIASCQAPSDSEEDIGAAGAGSLEVSAVDSHLAILQAIWSVVSCRWLSTYGGPAARYMGERTEGDDLGPCSYPMQHPALPGHLCMLILHTASWIACRMLSWFCQSWLSTCRASASCGFSQAATALISRPPWRSSCQASAGL